MAAHTHWRLYIGAVSNVYAQMGTVSFLNAAQVNQSTGGTATASSEYIGPWAAGNAFDGNPTSEWSSAGVSSSEWIAYQHPSPVDIVFVGVKVSTSYPVSGLALQYSDDGVSWSDASPLYLLAGQPALDSGSYTVLGSSASRRPLVVVDGRIKELPEGDTLPPQAPAAHSHATSDVTGLDAALAGKEPTISAGTTAQYWRGDKTWRDFFTDVRATTLTGLSTATNAAITAGDTVLVAHGKLQKQISDHFASTANAHPASAISNTPAGDIAATNVQAAINELDTEKLSKSGGTMTGALTLPANGLVVGTSQIVASGGNVGIGTSYPTAKLDVRSGTIRLSTDNARSEPFGINRSDTGSVNGMASIAMFGSGASSYLGNITFSTSRSDVYTSVLTEAARIDSSGNVLVTGGGGLGYGAGAGGTATQTGSRTSGVLLNKPSGQITLASAAGTTAWQSFTVTNSVVESTDTPIVAQFSGTDLYEIHVTAVATGSFRLSFRTTGGTTTEQPVFKFEIHKGATS